MDAHGKPERVTRQLNTQVQLQALLRRGFGTSVTFISLVALRGQIMTVEVHSGVCMKYSRWDIYIYIFDGP